MITIYTDGSARGNPGPGGYGAIVIGSKNVVELGGREDHTTNNRMEMRATIEALRFVQKTNFLVRKTLLNMSKFILKQTHNMFSKV